MGRRSPHCAAAANPVSCNKNYSNSSGWTPGWTPRHNYVDNYSREQRHCCHHFWSDLIDEEKTVDQNPSEFNGRGVKHVAQVAPSSNMMEGIFKKALPSLLLRPLSCNNSSSLSALSLNHEYLFTRRLRWMDHAIKANISW